MMLMLVLAGGAVACSSTEVDENGQEQVVSEESVVDDDVKVTVYVDGVYDLSAQYETPAGEEKIDFKFTLEDNVVTDLEVNSLAVHEVSVKLQQMFIDGIEAEVVGKKLDELGEFSAVNGSSLTPIGFNKAVADLKVEATM